MEQHNQTLVKVTDLTKLFPVGAGLFTLFAREKGFVHAVDGVSFEIKHGRSLGLVGESGCGKTTTGKLLVRLYEPTSGDIYLKSSDGDLTNIAHAKGKALTAFRRRVQMIFQDPYESLNPRRTIFDTIVEPLEVQGIGDLQERQERVAQMLHLVGVTPPDTFMFRFPHELSGGQRQRIAIARAVIVGPDFIVADGPTSML